MKEMMRKYTPFDLSKKEVRNKLRNRWIVRNDKTEEFQITKFRKDPVSNGWYIDTCNSIDLLVNFTFLDGSPCGEKVEE